MELRRFDKSKHEPTEEQRKLTKKLNEKIDELWDKSEKVEIEVEGNKMLVTKSFAERLSKPCPATD